jgi:hypothetical protein
MDEENYLTLVPVDRASFTREMKNLPPSTRAVAEVAIQRILARQGLTLATGNWLRSLGSGLWEFRIEKSFKAVFSKSEIPSPSRANNEAILIRVFCSFEKDEILLLGIYDKQRNGSGRKQDQAIQNARKALLQFKGIG